MKKRMFLIFALFVLSASSAAAELISDYPSSGPAAFVQMKGIPNLYRVSKDLFRSAQPTPEGMRNLNSLGIKTVINLCSGTDSGEAADLGLTYEHIPMQVWNPKEKQVIKFLQILMASKKTPVLLHCQHGADRTGTLCAVYRIAVEGWTKEEALNEMVDGGFGFHRIWAYLIEHWVNELNIDKIRREAGIQGREHLVGTPLSKPKALQTPSAFPPQ